MKVFMNNCKRVDHAHEYQPDVFYDMDLDRLEAKGLTPGQECIVATPDKNGNVTFNHFSFEEERVMRNKTDKVPCRVFIGELIDSETISKKAATLHPVYYVFFNVNGHFNRWSIISRKRPS